MAAMLGSGAGPVWRAESPQALHLDDLGAIVGQHLAGQRAPKMTLTDPAPAVLARVIRMSPAAVLLAIIRVRPHASNIYWRPSDTCCVSNGARETKKPCFPRYKSGAMQASTQLMAR